MKEVHYFYVPQAVTASELPADEAQHAVRVLRLQVGDELMLMDGCGTFYSAQVTLAANHHCSYRIVKTLPQQRPWKGRVHLAIAPTKLMDRIEWMVEKAVEIGVDDITLLDCQFSERHIVKTARLEKIVVAAAKQSRKAWMPQVHDMQPFQQFITQPFSGQKYIAHCYDEVERNYLFDQLRQHPTDDVLVLIGPEGDFSITEVQQAVAAGFQSVHLGSSRLRTETAGLSAVMMIQLKNS